MQKDTPPGTYYTDDKYRRLARWLQDVMAPPQEREAQAGALQGEEAPHFAIPPGEYHPHFYQQLPDFIMALLKYDWQAVSRYAPLLYHLVGCPTCHAGYLDLYDALREAVSVDDDQPHVSLPAQVNVPAARHLVQLCQLLITQAEAVLKQARHEHRDDAALAVRYCDWRSRVARASTRVPCAVGLYRTWCASRPAPRRGRRRSRQPSIPIHPRSPGSVEHGRAKLCARLLLPIPPVLLTNIQRSSCRIALLPALLHSKKTR